MKLWQKWTIAVIVTSCILFALRVLGINSPSALRTASNGLSKPRVGGHGCLWVECGWKSGGNVSIRVSSDSHKPKSLIYKRKVLKIIDS